MKKRVTIVDVAKETGFSVSAVSKALANADDISEETKSIIRKKCIELGYIQNISASALKSGNSRMIGILYDSFLNPFYNEMVYYIELGLKKLGYSITIFRYDKFGIEELTNIVSRSTEGLISFLEPQLDAIKMIKKISLPIVVAGRKTKYFSSIHADEKKVGNLAAEYALKQNSTNPIYIGELKTLSIVQERFEGFEKTFEKHGITPKSFCKDIYISNKDFLNKIGINNIVCSDCVFCFNDEMALDVIMFLKQNNCKDILVIGVDRIQKEMHIPIKMVSIGYDKQKVSKIITDELILQIKHKNNEIKDIIGDVKLELFDY